MRRPAYLWAHLATLSSLLIGVAGLTKPSEEAVLLAKYPKSLSEFGFHDAGQKGFVPSKALISYDLKVPLFSDYSVKFRYIYVPDGKIAKASGNGLIDFPTGSAIIKNFGFMQDGKMRLIETRLLLRREKEWLALPYVWNEAQDDAILKLAGARLTVNFTDPDDKQRTIDYAVPNKNQCKECHGVDDGISNYVMPIGPKIRNLQPSSVNILLKADILQIHGQSKTALWDSSDNILERKARVYLDINCAHCHNPHGSASNSGLFLEYEQNNPIAYGVYKRPVAAGRGSGGLKYAIKPGHAEESIIVHRMKSNDTGVAMPQIGRAITHDEGVSLVSNWIMQMDSKKYLPE